MKALSKTEGMNPSGVEMIYTPISLENLTNGKILNKHTTYFHALSTFKDVAREITSTHKITPAHLSRLESVLSDHEDYLNYDIDYLIGLIKEYLWYQYALDNWAALQVANTPNLYKTFALYAERIYNFIINTCNNALIDK